MEVQEHQDGRKVGFRRLARLFVARRWLVLVVALLAAGAAVVWARSHNEEVRPLFEAVAPVRFESPDARGGSNAPAVVESLDNAADIARDANSDAIAAGSGQVTVDERANELHLIARDDQRDQAGATATEMRETYFLAAAEGAENVRQARMDEIVAEATDLFDRLDELQPNLLVEPTLSEADQARLDFMSAQVDALQQRSSQLFGDLILAQLGDDRVGSPEEVQEELDLIELALEELRIEIVELDPTGELRSDRPTGSDSATGSVTARETSNGTEDTGSDLELDWTIEAINGRLDELQLEYEDLFLEQGSTTEAVSTTPGPLRVTDMTDPRLPVLLLALVGLLAGGLIAMGVVFAENRSRGRIVVAGDLPSSRLLAELPSWQQTSAKSSGWPKAMTSRLERLVARRLAAVKVLRQSVVGFVGQWSGPAIVGIGGSKVDHAEVEALALDLAHSMAATDRTVLLLDLDFTSKTGGIDDWSGTSVATILGRMRQNGGVSTTELESALLEGVPLAPSLRIITSGTPSKEPADLVLTSSFDLLLAAAKHQAEVVLAIVPESTAPEFAAVAQRLDGLVEVARVVRTRQRDLEPAINSDRLLGWVLLTHWRHPSTAWWLPGTGWRERLRRRVKSTEQLSPSIEEAATESHSVRAPRDGTGRAARHRARPRGAIESPRTILESEGEPRDVGPAVVTEEADDRSPD